MTCVFIDGQAGTTGIQITDRLSDRDDLELMFLDDSARKDPLRRQVCLQTADVSILCLPDEAARQAVELAAGKSRILDASTAYRTDPNWVYGLPEMCPEQRQLIANSQYVSNPGCYPQGFILLIRPLIEGGLLDPAVGLKCHAVSGYSGGGRQMIEEQRSWDNEAAECRNSQTYGLDLQHKHVPEMQVFAKTLQPPIFTPTVAHYYKGMLVHIPLFSSELTGSAADVRTTLHQRYAQEPFIQVLSAEQSADGGFLNPTQCNNTNNIELMVFDDKQRILLVARYDNLGKGAAGAAVQNLNIMLGIDEQTSL